MGLGAGNIDFDPDSMVTALRRAGVMPQELGTTHFDAQGDNNAFESPRLAKVELSASGGGSYDRNGIGPLSRLAAPAKHSDQLAEIHAGLEAASVARKPPKGESIG